MNCKLILIAFLAVGLLAGFAVLAHAAWVGFWNWFDDRMQNNKRIANEQLDTAYSTGQFYVPYTMRDMK
jgi:hypothetical protein